MFKDYLKVPIHEINQDTHTSFHPLVLGVSACGCMCVHIFVAVSMCMYTCVSVCVLVNVLLTDSGCVWPPFHTELAALLSHWHSWFLSAFISCLPSVLFPIPFPSKKPLDLKKWLY